MLALREALVAPLVRTYHSTLLDTGKMTTDTSMLHESFAVADLLADERYRLYACFDREELCLMLSRIRSSAVEMLSAS